MKKINYLDTIKSPVITEKATGLTELNKVVFKVHVGASKNSIKSLKPNMNVLILMGATAAYTYSLTGLIFNFNNLL